MTTSKMATTRTQKPWPGKQDAQKYLQQHKILEMFDNMTSMLIYNQPDNPKEYLTEQLEKLQTSRATKTNYPRLFDETNIQSIFGMLDPTGRGFITTQQYRDALVTMGIKDGQKNPAGSDVDKISLDTFMREAKLGLQRAAATVASK